MVLINEERLDEFWSRPPSAGHASADRGRVRGSLESLVRVSGKSSI
jgi:hypothetical protein